MNAAECLYFLEHQQLVNIDILNLFIFHIHHEHKYQFQFDEYNNLHKHDDNYINYFKILVSSESGKGSTSTSSSSSTSSTTITITSTTTLSSTTTTTMVEAVAQRAIATLDRAEEEATANLMASLLESLEGEPLSEPIFSTVTTSAGSEVTVALLTFVAAANQGQPQIDVVAVTSDGSFAPKVAVPLRVLDQLSGGGAAPVAISVSKIGGQAASDIEAVGLAKAAEFARDNNLTAEESGPSLLGSPFSITVYDSNGQPLEGLELSEPMTLTISEEANSSVACAFFNTTTYRWSTKGVRRVASTNVSADTLQPLVCETDHLSIFGGVLNVPEVDRQNYEVITFEQSNIGGGGSSSEDGDGVADGPVDQVGQVVETIIKCTRRLLRVGAVSRILSTQLRAAGIFSAEGMEALGKGSWSSSASAIALWATLLLLFFSSVAAFARDLTRNQTRWMGQLMSVTYPDQQEEDEDDVDEPKEDRAKSFSKSCVMYLHSLQAGVDRQSLEIALAVRTVGSKEGQELKKGKSPLYVAAMKLADAVNVSEGLGRATNLFLEANWLARMLLLFPAVHRALSAGHASLVVSRTSRVVLIFTKILLSCGLAALFFQGSARGNDSEASCIEGGGLGLTVVLGFAAAFVGDFVLYGLNSLRKQNFKSARSNVGLQLKVKEWRVRNALFWAIIVLVLVISTYIIMVFFATVTQADSDTWAAAALVVILEEFFFGPFLVSAGFALLATFTMEGDTTIAQSLRTASGTVQKSPYNAWAPSAEDFRVPVPHEAQHHEGQLRSLGSAQPAPEAPDVVLSLADRHQEEMPNTQVALNRQEIEEQKRLQEELREQLELQKKQLEQQRIMQAELREQLQRQQQQQEMVRNRSPPPERPPARYEQQQWQQDNQTQRLPGAVPLQVPRPMVTRPPQQVTSVNLGLQRSVRHGAVVRSGRPGPPSWPPPALRGFDAGGRPLQRPGQPVPSDMAMMRRHSRGR
eukprot:s111_g7.t2